jgi:hypothetical protein
MKKKILFYISLILLSVLITLVIYSLFYSFYLVVQGSEKATEILTKASVYLLFLRLTGTLAFVFIGIAASLGAMRNIIFSFYKNTAFWKIHTQWASSIGIGMATAHLTIYLLYEWRLKVPLTLKLFYPNFARFNSTNNLIFLSTTALILFTINFIVSNIPALKAKSWWKPLHILNYFGFFLVLYHAFYLGSNSSELLFQILYAVFLILALSGALHRFYKFVSKSRNKPPQTPPPVPQQTITQSINTPPVQPTAPVSTTPIVPTPGNGMPMNDEEFKVIKPSE